MRKNLKVGVYTLVSFVLLIFMIGALTLNKKGENLSADSIESNIGNSIINFGNAQSNLSYGNSENTRTEEKKYSPYNELHIVWNGNEISITESEDIKDISMSVITGNNKRDIYSTGYITNKNKIIKINNKSLTDSLEILIPTDCFSDDITIDAPGANIFLNGINIENIEVETDFGNVLAKNITAESMDISSHSGIIYTIGGNYIVLEAESDKGTVSVNSNSDEYYLTTEEGNIYFKPVIDWVRADIESETGSITLNLITEYPHTIELQPDSIPINFDDISQYEQINNRYIYKEGYAYINVNSENSGVYVYTTE